MRVLVKFVLHIQSSSKSGRRHLGVFP